MTELKKRYKFEEVEKVKTNLLESNFGINSQADKINSLYEEYKKVSNEFKVSFLLLLES